MKKSWFESTPLNKKDWPKDYIPKGAKTFTGFDMGSPDGGCTVRGYYIDGVLYVQDVEHHINEEQRKCDEDLLLFGTSMKLVEPDGTIKRIPPEDWKDDK